jgi:DNA-binding Lrp family transcriptional regulator
MKGKPLKDIELRLISELMINCHRSDRELAKAVGSSQPTICRIRTKLEKEGVIKEYTMIPDFKQLGYEIMAFQFLKKPETYDQVQRQKLRKAASELERNTPQSNIMVVDGIGLGKGRVLINVYRNYADYVKGLTTIRSLPHVEAESIDGFLVDLSDKGQFRVLSMKEVARHILSSVASKTEQAKA